MKIETENRVRFVGKKICGFQYQMNSPLVTVLMPVFNGENYLSQAIESILNQTFPDFEFLIINDGSTDRSEKIILSYSDPRIRYVKNETNLGVIKTLNLGINLSKGNYIARMDCDDISVSNRLEKQVEILNNNRSCDLVATKILLIDENGNRSGYWDDDILTTSYEEIKNYIPNLNCIAHPSIMIRTEIARIFQYHTDQKHSEDWDLWLRLISDNRVITKIDETLLHYRIHSNSVTSQANKKNVYRKIFNVQKNYILKKIRQGKLNDFDKQVLKSSLASFDKAFLKGRIVKYGNRLKKFLNKKIVSKIYGRYQFFKVLFKFLNSTNKSGMYFFFPFYHVGGAERVHIDILKVVKEKKPFIFITNRSENEAFLKEFENTGEVFYIGEMGKIRKRIWERVITKAINKIDKPILFGCNSYFFYSIIPKIKPEARIIDLIHAFSGKDYKAAEDWSLPYAERIDKRVFISNRTIEDLKNQYLSHKIPSDLLNRVEYIPNYTNINQNYQKEIKGETEVIFVGRGSKEKRVHLIGKIARECGTKNLPFNFTIIGNVKDSLSKEYHPYFKFLGEISDPKKINNIYSKSHIILITSEREGMPMVIMEGMANGVVPICTSVGDIPLHVLSGKTGYTVDNNLNEEDIVSSFVRILEEISANRSSLKELSRNAYEYAKENFARGKFETAYKKLLSN